MLTVMYSDVYSVTQSYSVVYCQFRSYECLRREHDGQIIRMAMEAGLRISPEQWSTLLYGDHKHKSDMQSIIDKVCSPLGAGFLQIEVMCVLCLCV